MQDDARMWPVDKNDYLDAEAIAEASTTNHAFRSDQDRRAAGPAGVAPGARDRWVARRTAVMNQIRGFLMERGITIRKGPSHLTTQLQEIWKMPIRPCPADCALDSRTEARMGRTGEANRRSQRGAAAHRKTRRCMPPSDGDSRLRTAGFDSTGGGHRQRDHLPKGRDLSAWLGLVPRQHSTGGKTRLLGISKWETNICDECSCTGLDPWWRKWDETPPRLEHG